MEYTNITQLDEEYALHRHKDLVIAYGYDFCVCDLRGNIILWKKKYIGISKIIFVSDDCVILDSWVMRTYIAFSLTTRKELWRTPYPRVTMTAGKFIVSPDGTRVYDYCYYRAGYSFKYKVLSFDIATGTLEQIFIQNSIGHICDMVFDENGDFYLLEVTSTKSAVRNLPLKSAKPEKNSFYKYQWRHAYFRTPEIFFKDAQHVLTRNLLIKSFEKTRSVPLSKNQQDLADFCPVNFCFDAAGKYIIISDLNVNVVIDMPARKMIARYVGSILGCIVEDEFWIWNPSGIQRKPFPIIEDLPPKKLTTMVESFCDDYI